MQVGILKGAGHLISWLVAPSFVLLAAIVAIRQADARAEALRIARSQGHFDDVKKEPSWEREQDKASVWSPELIKSLEWKRVEQLAAIYFRTLKFRVEEALPGPDGGVDLRLYVAGSKSPGALVQCKAWNSWQVGVDKIRELFGVMAHEGVNEGIFVTTSTFTRDAAQFARGKNIALIDGADLLRKLLDLPPEDQQHILNAITAGDYITPTCPSCGIKMVTRVAKASGDAFWGCPEYPKCRTTIQMGRPQA